MCCERSVDMDLGIGGTLSAETVELLKDGSLSLESDFRIELNEGLRTKSGSPGNFCKNVLSGRRVLLLMTLAFLDGDPADSGASSLSTFPSICIDLGGLE